MSVTVKLSRPITAIDQTFTELTFREPTGADVVASGHPIGSDGKLGKVDAESVAVLIGRLAGLPRRSVDEMPISDWSACMKAVMGFFGDGDPKSSTDSSSAVDGGVTSASRLN